MEGRFVSRSRLRASFPEAVPEHGMPGMLARLAGPQAQGLT